MPVLYTSTRTLKPFEDSEPTGLKVDIADCLLLLRSWLQDCLVWLRDWCGYVIVWCGYKIVYVATCVATELPGVAT